MKSLNKKYKEFSFALLLIITGIYVVEIYQESFTNKCIFSRADNVVHNESRYCTKNGDVLKNQFAIYELNMDEEALIIFIYEYSGSKENGIATDKIDDKNFLTLTRDYIKNYKASSKYKENLKFFDYIYKNYYPTKYENFKKAIK